jgi:hypothetical protein
MKVLVWGTASLVPCSGEFGCYHHSPPPQEACIASILYNACIIYSKENISKGGENKIQSTLHTEKLDEARVNIY